MGKGSQPVEPFRIIIHKPVSLEQLGQELSGLLSTIKELVSMWLVNPWHTEGCFQTDQWCYILVDVADQLGPGGGFL